VVHFLSGDFTRGLTRIKIYGIFKVNQFQFFYYKNNVYIYIYMDYKSKYIKYKKKYLNLKNTVDDYDGGMSLVPQCPFIKTDREAEKCGKCISLIECSNRSCNKIKSCCDPVTMTNYLDNVNIDEKIKKKLMEKLMDKLKISLNKKLKSPNDSKEFSVKKPGHQSRNIFNVLREKINDKIEKYNKTKNDWYTCDNECFKFFNNIINSEIKTTAYILRAISNCILKKKNSEEKLSFKLIDNVSLDGMWEEDKKKIKIELSSKEKGKKKRLIMGFGPSASGKTYMAQNIIDWLTTEDNTFPEIFLSIDGGSMREASVTYRYITKQMQLNESDKDCKTLKGFKNLSSTSPFAKSLFKKPKKKIFDFFKNNDNIISVYVPETLGGFPSCQFMKTCISSHIYKDNVKKYKEYTNDDNWIGLFIWQHKSECPIKGYKCEGVISKGTSREIEEGKKYGSNAYDISFHAGLTMLKSAHPSHPSHSLEIHNSGGMESSKSIIVDYTELFKNIKIDDENIIYLKSNKDQLEVDIKKHDDFLRKLIQEREKEEDDCRSTHTKCGEPDSEDCKKVVKLCMSLKEYARKNSDAF
jgi:hypothetical protein